MITYRYWGNKGIWTFGRPDEAAAFWEGLNMWECFKDKKGRDEWRVEAIDGEDCLVTIFAGPGAEERATEYAVFKNGQVVTP